MKKIIITLLAVVFIGFGISVVFANLGLGSSANVTRTADIEKISYTEVFDRDETEYLVYFWQETCSFCKEFEPDILEAYNSGIPVFVVDMHQIKNSSAWYDWEGHHEEHSVVIGQVRNGVQVLDPGQSEDNFPREEGWSIVINNKDEVVAQLNQAFNNQSPTSPEELEISGTPTLIRIKDGQVVGYAEGVEAGRTLLNKFGQ